MIEWHGEILQPNVHKSTGGPKSKSNAAYNSQRKKRLILDLRHVNKYLFKLCVKYEAFDVLKNYVTKYGFMVKFDLKSGYHYINIFK